MLTFCRNNIDFRPLPLYILSKSGQKFSRGDFMEKYICPCGYVYDPALGDPEHGVAPGTKWEDVPEDWLCPTCGLGKDMFVEE